MKSFTRLSARAVPLLIDDVDTDMIFPAQFATTLGSKGLADCLFARERFDADGAPVTNFALNRPEFRGAEILISGANFGCGSSREHAVWALRDFGFRCIVAVSFADIFYSNCFRNGILPLPLPRDIVDELGRKVEKRPSTTIAVDLEGQTVEADGIERTAFAIDPFRRDMLLKGLDEIGLTLQDEPEIGAFEKRHIGRQPWLRVRTRPGGAR